MDTLSKYYETVDPEFIKLRAVCKDILQSEEDLKEIVQLVGKDSLAESDKVILEVAKLIREDFLAQNSYTTYDKYCPFYKTVGMLKNFVHFYNEAQRAVRESSSGHKVTWNTIKTNMGKLIYKLSSQKFLEPDKGKEYVEKQLKALNDEITESFRSIDDDM
jgi:V-type H+-transporting ATPase subunit A